MTEESLLMLFAGTEVVYPHNDPNFRPVECGASIFVEAHRHLVKAARVS